MRLQGFQCQARTCWRCAASGADVYPFKAGLGPDLRQECAVADQVAVGYLVRKRNQNASEILHSKRVYISVPLGLVEAWRGAAPEVAIQQDFQESDTFATVLHYQDRYWAFRQSLFGLASQ